MFCLFINTYIRQSINRRKKKQGYKTKIRNYILTGRDKFIVCENLRDEDGNIFETEVRFRVNNRVVQLLLFYER